MTTDLRAAGWNLPGYRPIQVLGSGASGHVVRAVEERTGRTVAVKYLSDALRSNPDVVTRFRVEARLLESLSSAYVARMYQYREAVEGAAIVMELVDGVSLGTLLREQGTLAPESALCILKGSLLGLSAAHTAGVVHRDYKPGNVLVDRQGHSKLVDFGIAVHQGAEARAAGTPAYMAPEQWMGLPASPATDVYAATVTFFECIIGELPYRGQSLPELAVQHVSGPIPDRRVPDPVQTLIREGLAKSPEQRPSDAISLLSSLEHAARVGYGETWEERGRHALAALVAMFLVGSPVPGPGGGSVDSATTILHPRPRARHRRPPRHSFPSKFRGTNAAAVTAAVAGLLSVAALSSGFGQEQSTANSSGDIATSIDDTDPSGQRISTPATPKQDTGVPDTLGKASLSSPPTSEPTAISPHSPSLDGAAGARQTATASPSAPASDTGSPSAPASDTGSPSAPASDTGSPSAPASDTGS
ncbi:protein kinase, partial [Streptomyces sp. NPDC060027]|uniref:serine/threonine protein kinase n=1 Tax=Streptomyces sp. NPDC060027 TaxID=3347040 RepID=UPI00368F9583